MSRARRATGLQVIGTPFRVLAGAEQYGSDKLTLSLDVFCREKPKSESLVPSRPPDFAGMMRPGHDQSTPFGLSTAQGARRSRRFIAQNENRHRLFNIPRCRMTKRAEARAPLFCLPPGKRVLTQLR
jgi:hypothetical protein